MNSRRICSFRLASILLCSACAYGVEIPAALASDFLVFDGTLYRDKPDLSAYGVRPINIIYSGKFWNDKNQMDRAPAAAAIDHVAAAAATRGDVVAIDIEHWPLHRDAEETRQNIQKYMAVLRAFRTRAPGLTVGLFGMLPIPDYDRARGALGPLRYQRWRADNDRLTPLAQAVDVIFPAAYTEHPDPAEWVKYATALIEESRRYGKPVYVFLWPQYSERNTELGYRPLPVDFWLLQLATARRLADGVVIWGGWDPAQRAPASWDDDTPWWRATRQFMQQLERDRPAPVRGGKR